MYMYTLAALPEGNWDFNGHGVIVLDNGDVWVMTFRTDEPWTNSEEQFLKMYKLVDGVLVRQTADLYKFYDDTGGLEYPNNGTDYNPDGDLRTNVQFADEPTYFTDGTYIYICDHQRIRRIDPNTMQILTLVGPTVRNSDQNTTINTSPLQNANGNSAYAWNAGHGVVIGNYMYFDAPDDRNLPGGSTYKNILMRTSLSAPYGTEYVIGHNVPGFTATAVWANANLLNPVWLPGGPNQIGKFYHDGYLYFTSTAYLAGMLPSMIKRLAVSADGTTYGTELETLWLDPAEVSTTSSTDPLSARGRVDFDAQASAYLNGKFYTGRWTGGIFQRGCRILEWDLDKLLEDYATQGLLYHDYRGSTTTSTSTGPWFREVVNQTVFTDQVFSQAGILSNTHQWMWRDGSKPLIHFPTFSGFATSKHPDWANKIAFVHPEIAMGITPGGRYYQTTQVVGVLVQDNDDRNVVLDLVFEGPTLKGYAHQYPVEPKTTEGLVYQLS